MQSQKNQKNKDYNFEDHIHNYAVWTAARAVQRSFVKTQVMQEAIESTRLRSIITGLEIKTIKQFDEFHDDCCQKIIRFFKKFGIDTSYGRAAKIVSVYIKTAVVIRDSGKSQVARIAHPPVDNKWLRNLEKEKKQVFVKKPWTNLDRDTYLKMISDLRNIQGDEFWKLEGAGA